MYAINILLCPDPQFPFKTSNTCFQPKRYTEGEKGKYIRAQLTRLHIRLYNLRWKESRTLWWSAKCQYHPDCLWCLRLNWEHSEINKHKVSATQCLEAEMKRTVQHLPPFWMGFTNTAHVSERDFLPTTALHASPQTFLGCNTTCLKSSQCKLLTWWTYASTDFKSVKNY